MNNLSLFSRHLLYRLRSQHQYQSSIAGFGVAPAEEDASGIDNLAARNGPRANGVQARCEQDGDQIGNVTYRRKSTLATSGQAHSAE